MVFGEQTMAAFNPVSALLGGGLIALASALLMLLNGRIAGISGILGGAPWQYLSATKSGERALRFAPRAEGQQSMSDMIADITASCQIVSAGPEFVGKHGYLCAPGISRQSVGARGINLQIAIIPPAAWAKAHKHDGHETALHILSGEAGMWYGKRLEQHLIARAGDFLYIPPDMPHLPYNLSNIETCVAIIARTDPTDQEGVVLLPELERVSRSDVGVISSMLTTRYCAAS